MLGITSFMSSNCILTELDFFIYYQKDYNPEFNYAVTSMLVSVFVQAYLVFFTHKLGSYRSLLFISMISFISILFLIPLIVVFLPELLGFIAMLLVMVFIGVMGTTISSSIYGIVSILPAKYIIAMSAGQAFSGIILNIIKYIILLTFDSTDGKSPDETKSIYFQEVYIFYSSATAFVVATAICVMVRKY